MEIVKNIIRTEEDAGLTPTDNWKATDAMYLEDIGFKNDGIFYYALKKPEMKLSHKKGVGFILEEVDTKVKNTFPNFKALEEYFANYKQKWENTPYGNNDEGL